MNRKRSSTDGHKAVRAFREEAERIKSAFPAVDTEQLLRDYVASIPPCPPPSLVDLTAPDSDDSIPPMPLPPLDYGADEDEEDTDPSHPPPKHSSFPPPKAKP